MYVHIASTVAMYVRTYVYVCVCMYVDICVYTYTEMESKNIGLLGLGNSMRMLSFRPANGGVGVSTSQEVSEG